MPFDFLNHSDDSVASSLPVWSYLDPGTGSYALQLLLAGLFGGLFVLKQSWQQFRAWFALVILEAAPNPASIEGSD